MREIVLDSNVVAGFALADEGKRDLALARVKAARRESSHILISPTCAAELAATYRSTDKFERLLEALAQLCDGMLPISAEEMLPLEVTQADPYSTVTSRPPLPVQIDALRRAVQDEKVQAFYKGGAFGAAQLKHLLDALDGLDRKVKADTPSSFLEFVEPRRLLMLDALVRAGVDRGYIREPPADLDALWKKGAALRFVTLVFLANVYRRVKRTHTKGEGCLSDLRTSIEAAYSDQIWTADQEFAECGHLANKLCSKPTVSFWNPRD